MSHRDEFSLENEYNDDGSETGGIIVLPDRKHAGPKTSQAAWSRVEDVLAERRLARELTDYLDADDV